MGHGVSFGDFGGVRKSRRSPGEEPGRFGPWEFGQQGRGSVHDWLGLEAKGLGRGRPCPRGCGCGGRISERYSAEPPPPCGGRMRGAAKRGG